MMRGQRTSAPVLLRITAAIIAAAVLIVTAVVAPSTPTASAKSHTTAVFGTVLSEPQPDRIEIATRSGVISLKINKRTEIYGETSEFELSDVVAGMTVVGYYVHKDDEPVARNLTFLVREETNQYEHVIGVVLEISGSTITVQTSTGEIVVIESGENLDTAIVPGSLIAMALEQNATTGTLTLTAIQTAQATVERLSESINYQISLAQRQLLEIRMSETAAVHMTRLYETLDDIQADTQVKIQTAYAVFKASYEATLNESINGSVTVQTSGTVLNVTATELHIQSLSDDTRWHLRVTDDTVVILLNGTLGTIEDIAVGHVVELSATPGTALIWPVAIYVRAIFASEPVPEPPPSDGSITGTIVIVEPDPSGTGTVIVVTQEDGSDGAASLTEDTVITVDGEQLGPGELVPGQDVEIVLADDGISAEQVTATEPVEPPPAPSAPGPPLELKLIGTLRSIDTGGVILDDVQLKLGSFSTTWDTSTVGQQVELQFFLDNLGRLVITGSK
ncbi:MAG: hypothetical protein O6922_02755 [Chloroflexi bacterium]|nr:hypothetical protein [Chloroflexota bacterium]